MDKKQYSKIASAFSDAYYALYIIDFEKERYEILKGSEYIRDFLPQRGDYIDFIEAFETIMEKETYKEFKVTFSIENIRRLIRNGERTLSGDYRRLFSGEYKWVNVQMIYSKENIKSKRPEVIFAFQNINQKKEKELEEKEVLLESIQTVQAITKSKSIFFSNMSHDMRTPLNAIINLSKMAKEKIEDKEKTIDYLDKINIASVQLLELLNSILEVSRLEENIPLVNKTEINIKTSLENVITVFKEQAKIQKKKFEVVCNIKHEYVICDFGKVRQILNNILSNALKYTRTNGNIYLEINEIEGKFVSKYEFKIIDDGIGMSKEFLNKIYTPFERETRFHTEEMNGTGLGMAIVQNNVQKLNGQIEVTSKAGEGSEVYVVLPLEIGEEIIQKENKQKQHLESLEGKRILIVEDNELNREISTEVLQMQGVKIIQAFDGIQAVNTFANSVENYFDAILMDIKMPNMDGYEATRTIRRLPRKDAKTIPILAVSANMFADDIIEAEKSGMDDYIGKPIDFKELQKALTKYIRKDSL